MKRKTDRKGAQGRKKGMRENERRRQKEGEEKGGREIKTYKKVRLIKRVQGGPTDSIRYNGRK